MDYGKISIDEHRKNVGKLDVVSRFKITNKDELSVAYTPGVAAPCLLIERDKKEAFNLTSSKNTVAVITDGSAVLGLGDIGPEAALPVMEGKAVLFKQFGGVNAFPIALATKDVDEIVRTVKMIAPTFGGINLEDISAPRCFEIEERLKEELDIPVFHDDQHGTAIVVLAGLINALKVVLKNKEGIRVVINGSGAAGIAISRLLIEYGIRNIIMCDSKGVVSSARQDLNFAKEEFLAHTNIKNVTGTLQDAIKGSDVFIGVSKGNLLKAEDVRSMNRDPIIFAMANPMPEIMPDIAKDAGAKVVATGRSDYPNQLNNVLVFPGIFKGAFEIRARKITTKMKIAAAIGLANAVSDLSEDNIIPSPFDPNVAQTIAKSVVENYEKE